MVVSNGLCVRSRCDEETGTASGRDRPSKWALQRTAQRLLPEERISRCNIAMAKSAEYVTVRRNEEAAWFTGLVHCGNVWACPVCARKVGEQRRTEMQQAIDTAIGAGGGVAMLTQTFSHQLYHKIDALLPRLAAAQRILKSGRKWQRVKEKYGIYGSVRALEVTHGRNGWHPHVHEIEFFERPLDDEQHKTLEKELFELWESACAKAGLGLPDEKHGVTVRRASHAAQYIGKWGFASELTRPCSKGAFSKGSTPWQLLEDAHHGSVEAGHLFVEFYNAFKGRRQLVWSKGLRERLDLGEETSDTEQAELELVRPGEEPPISVVEIKAGLWNYLCSIPRAREFLLRLVMTCEHYDEVRGWLQGLVRSCPDRIYHPDGSMTSYEYFKLNSEDLYGM